MSSLSATNTGAGPLIEITGLVMTYPDGRGVIPVLKGLDLTVAPGDMVAVMGPSGSGKSTLLHIMSLFMKPTAGKYKLGGLDALALDRLAQATVRGSRLGFVSQSCDLLEKSTVYENLELPLVYGKVPHEKRRERIAAALAKVGLTHRMDHAANRLSGGEQQRVAVARALVNRPQVILADEPTGQLDRANSELIMEHFSEIVAAGDTALVMVSHDPHVAGHCHRAYGLEDGVLVPMHLDKGN